MLVISELGGGAERSAAPQWVRELMTTLGYMSYHFSNEILSNRNIFWTYQKKKKGGYCVNSLQHQTKLGHGMSVEDSPFIAFIFMPLRAFPASRRFLNCTKAKPRIFPSVRKCTKTLKVAGGSQQNRKITVVRLSTACPSAKRSLPQNNSLYPL